VDDVGWVAMGNDDNQVMRKLEACRRESIVWAERWEMKVDSAKSEAAHFTSRRGHKTHHASETNIEDTSGERLCQVHLGSDQEAGVLQGCPPYIQRASQPMHEES